MSKKQEPIINGIDVSEYFIEVADEGGSTIDYKILPNSERLLVEKIFEQNQQLKSLQQENEELKSRNANLRLNLATYDLPEVKKVLTDWRTGELDKKFKKLQKENEKLRQNWRLDCLKCEYKNTKADVNKYKQALEEIREIIEMPKYTCKEFLYIRGKIDEVLNDRN